MIGLWSFFWLVGGEVSGSQHQSSGFSGSEVSVLVGSIWLTSPTSLGCQYLHAPGLQCCSLTVPPLQGCPFLSLSSNCLNLCIGNQVRSGRLNEAYSRNVHQFSSVARSRLTLQLHGRQASLSITNYWSLLKLMSVELVMPSVSSSVIPFSYLQSFPASGSSSESVLCIRSPEYWSFSPMNAQDWFPLGLTGLFFLQSKGLSRVFSNTIVQKHQFFGAQLSF